MDVAFADRRREKGVLGYGSLGHLDLELLTSKLFRGDPENPYPLIQEYALNHIRDPSVRKRHPRSRLEGPLDPKPYKPLGFMRLSNLVTRLLNKVTILISIGPKNTRRYMPSFLRLVSVSGFY